MLQSFEYDNADCWRRANSNFTSMLCISQLGIYKVKIISVFLIQQLFLTNSLIFIKRCTRPLNKKPLISAKLCIFLKDTSLLRTLNADSNKRFHCNCYIFCVHVMYCMVYTVICGVHYIEVFHCRECPLMEFPL